MQKKLKSLIFSVLSLLFAVSLSAQTGTDKVLYENSAGTAAGAYTLDQIKTFTNTGLGTGSVTSVSATVPTGLAVSGSPITTSGTLAITNNMAAGFVSSSGVGGSLTSSATISGAAISGNITGNAANVTGTVAVANGGTGATTLTGYLVGNGTSAVTASSTIPTTALSGTVSNAQLANSALTINGTSRALGSTTTIDLASVTGQGATTSTASTFSGGLTSSGATTVSGGLNYGVGTQITGATTLAATDVFREINVTASTTVTVPSGLATGRHIELPLNQASTGQITIATAASDTFNGASTFVVAANSQGTTIRLTKLSSTAWRVSLGW